MIPYLTVKKHLIKQQPVLVEEVPLGMDDWYSQQGTPYLRVYGLPKMPEMSEKDVKQVLVSTFGNQLSSGDQGVLNVSMTSTSEAVVQFVDNNGKCMSCSLCVYLSISCLGAHACVSQALLW